MIIHTFFGNDQVLMVVIVSEVWIDFRQISLTDSTEFQERKVRSRGLRGGFLEHLNNSERERKREGKSERDAASFGRLEICAVKPKRAPSSKTWSDHVGAHFCPAMKMCTDKSCSWPGGLKDGAR